MLVRADGTPAQPLEPFQNAPKLRNPRRSKTQIIESIECASGKQKKSRKLTAPSREFDSSKKTMASGRPQSMLAIQIQENRERFPGCLLLTRVGQFYESYFEQAPEIADLLGIKLTSRPWGGKGKRVAMCGFPLSHLDRHLKSLVETHSRFVALCEEFPPTPPSTEFVRKVVRVVTPGTLIDESFVNTYANNYLLSVVATSEGVGLAWIDLSTGDFFSQASTEADLRDDIARINPREVVLHEMIAETPEHPLIRAIGEGNSVTVTYALPLGPVPTSKPGILNTAEADPQEINIPLVYTSHELSAIQLLTTVLEKRLLDYMPTLPSPQRQDNAARMQIDSHTISALEIREVMHEGGLKGSLLSTVKRTVTPGGTRLLLRWLCSPSTCISEIESRQSLVALLYASLHLRADFAAIIHRAKDVSRIVQRFILMKGDVEDLISIKDAIEMWRDIVKRIAMEGQCHTASPHINPDWLSLERLATGLKDLNILGCRISSSIDELEVRTVSKLPSANPSNDLEDSESQLDSIIDAEGVDSQLEPSSETYYLDTDIQATDKRAGPAFVIKPQFSLELSNQHAFLKQAYKEREELEHRLRAEFCAPSLTLKFHPRHGFYVHIGKIKEDTIISRSMDTISISKSKSTRSYLHKDWISLGRRTVDVEGRIAALERAAFVQLRDEVVARAQDLRLNARIVDELDVAVGFAELATEMRFVRPKLNASTSYKVTNGRHPTVELGLLCAGRNFVPNDVALDDSERLHIITGPNMSGKSSLLRQTALIAILAQVGSFVPADHAEIGLVDKVFSRVGAKDDLYRDRSTFMVEMLETSDILHRATEHSLVIMDEVGRGTTMKDGLAIAFAAVHHLYHVNKCRGLFATHFHELTDMLGFSLHEEPTSFPHIGFYCTDVDEIEGGGFTYSHRLKPGVNRDSHGLKVAELAGMPPEVLRVASTALKWMHDRDGNFIADRASLKRLGENLSAFSDGPIV